MSQNFLSGLSVNTDIAMMFKAFEDNKCYLTFSRQNDTWGTCALINISFPDSITNIVNDDYKFNDKNCENYSLDSSSVRIYKTTKSAEDFTSVASEYTMIPQLAELDTPITLQYISKNWCTIKGLPSDFSTYINTLNDEKFYIVSKQPYDTYNNSPDLNNVKMVKINKKVMLDNSSINTPVFLYYYDGTSDTLVLETSQLMRNINILKEIKITGFNKPADFNEADFVSKAQFFSTNVIPEIQGFFYFRNANGTKVSDDLFLMKKDNKVLFSDTIGKEYILFKSRDVANHISYIKIEEGISENGLAIFHESLPFNFTDQANAVSDVNPPATLTDYTRCQNFHKSLTDIQGYVQLYKSVPDENINNYESIITYCRELRDPDNEKILFQNYGFDSAPLSTMSKRFETIELTTDTQVTRYGNIRNHYESGDQSVYSSTATRLYLYTVDFLVNDNILISATEGGLTDIAAKIVSVNYEKGFIDLYAPIGTTIHASTSNSNMGESSQIKIDTNPDYVNNIIDTIEYAVCDNYEDAITYGMNSVKVHLRLPKTAPDLYDGTYRQLSICYEPKVWDNNLNIVVPCTDRYYKNTPDISLFNTLQRRYENNIVLYIANRAMITRKFLKNGTETFDIII